MEGEPSLSHTTDDTHQVQITSSDTNAPVIIDEKPPTQSHKTLGIMENPSGNYTDEYASLQQKSQHWRNCISNQYLNRQESKLFYQSFFIPSI